VLVRIIKINCRHGVGSDFVFHLIEREPLKEKRCGHLPLQAVNIPLAQIAGEPEEKETLRAAS